MPTKVTLKLSDKTVEALTRAAATVELNRTDTVNRAIQLYDYLTHALDGGGVLLVERGGKTERILFR